MAVSARRPAPVPIDVSREPGRHMKRPRRRSRAWSLVREFVIIVFLALVVSALVRAFLFQAFYVPSSSMEDTLLPSDRIIAVKIATQLSGVQRGEVVVFKDPGGWLAPPEPLSGWRGIAQQGLTFVGLLPSDSGSDLVKRVIAIGGDRIACCDPDGRIVLNGEPLDEDYIVGPTDQVRFDVTVPEGGLFVMGDNRADSSDSRYYLEDDGGSVPVDSVVGRVMLTIWPVTRMSTVPALP
jgi:signal peptidase I